LANRPENIRIHLAVSRVRFCLLRFNSSGNFCDCGAILKAAQQQAGCGEEDKSDGNLCDDEDGAEARMQPYARTEKLSLTDFRSSFSAMFFGSLKG
jgi:hypothetical protein